MLAALTACLTARASWRNILVTAALAAVGAWLDIRIVGPAFAAATGGIPVFDLQPGLKPADIWQQLPHYTAESRRLYAWFFWLDNAFPLAAFTAVALLWARLMALTSPAWAARYAGLALIPFGTLLCDWAENLAFFSLIGLWPTQWPWLAGLACLLHFGKFVCLTVSNMGILVLAASAAVGYRRRSLHANR